MVKSKQKWKAANAEGPYIGNHPLRGELTRPELANVNKDF